MRGIAWLGMSAVVTAALVGACGSDAVDAAADGGTRDARSPDPAGDAGTAPAAATCAAAGGSADVAKPVLRAFGADGSGESWLASPGVADLDGDGKPEIVTARGSRVHVLGPDGASRASFDTGEDRIWASPVVGNFAGDAKLEIAVATRDKLFILDTATMQPLPGFPVTGGTETRALAAGDLDGDGALDAVVAVRRTTGAATDVVSAYRGTGQAVPGFPPVASGTAGCDPGPCYFAGLYDQNVAVGDLDGDGNQDLVVPHDNAYASFFKGSGAAFDSNPMFAKRPKTPGVRYLHTLSQAQQGFADDEDTETQAHFTNTAPAIADIDGDGTFEVIMLGSAQNAAQTDRLRGVGLWVVRSDASRLPGWERPFEATGYVVGLADGFARGLDDDAVSGASNLVGATNQVTVADLDGSRKGKEMLFAGFDGVIHAVGADKTELWATPYAADGRELTGGVLVADLSGDGVPEVVFATYSPDAGRGALYVLASDGKLLHEVPLPGRGAMAVPTIGDVDGDGKAEIVVSLKDEEDGGSVAIFEVATAKANCLLWPTGRGNLLRSGWVR